MDLVWEDPPVPDTLCFTRDLYDKYSLAPNIRELWTSLQSPGENANIKTKHDGGPAKSSCSPSTEESAELKDHSCIRKEESCLKSCISGDLCAAGNIIDSAEECNDTKRSAELKQVDTEADAPYPAPRRPYPCLSALATKEHIAYLEILLNKKTPRLPPQNLMSRINREVMEFMRYLQDVAKTCGDDYNVISEGAMQYTEEFLGECLKGIERIPQLYQIHEMTSLTGGTFNPGLRLTFEKQLLIMGSVDITDHKIVPTEAQLASDYQNVSSVNPPAKKAKDMHAAISSDSNAEKLCSRYEPHVCLTPQALVRLLDNHGPDFGEHWECPVWVKLNPGKGSGQKRTVYIDSPLLKTEMTVRERSHIYHEESLKLSIRNNGSKNVFHVLTEQAEEQQLSASSQRNLVSLENDSLYFEVDLNDLETFGESPPIKIPKVQTMKKLQESCGKSKSSTSSPSSETKNFKGQLSTTTSNPLEEINSPYRDQEDAITERSTKQVISDNIETEIEQKRPDSLQESDQDITFTEDSDDEKLVIDDSVCPAVSPTKLRKPKTAPPTSGSPVSPVSESVPVKTETSSPHKSRKQSTQSKRVKVPGDQLSDILRMQSAMFNSAKDTAKSTTISQETASPTKCTGPSVHCNTTSLVKPCVTSYLERQQNQDGATCIAPHNSPPTAKSVTLEHKKILSSVLQDGAEDEQDYEAPGEGNLIYKLYSLQDLLLMVRSSVSLTHTRRVGGGQTQHVPVHVLPKLEYQLCYGIECLNSSEACQLWTEKQLHSSTVSYTAHINAFTSKVALVRKLPDDWKPNTSCGFNPTKSLNILHHLLKKLTRLEEGHYLVVHKAGDPFATLLKAVNGKAARASYNLEQIHSSVPQPPSSGLVPWIPVDPAVVLPFHKKHNQVPCTFPVKHILKPPYDGPSSTNKTRKRNKRAARRNNYMKNLIQKSI